MSLIKYYSTKSQLFYKGSFIFSHIIKSFPLGYQSLFNVVKLIPIRLVSFLLETLIILKLGTFIMPYYLNSYFIIITCPIYDET